MSPKIIAMFDANKYKTQYRPVYDGWGYNRYAALVLLENVRTTNGYWINSYPRYTAIPLECVCTY